MEVRVAEREDAAVGGDEPVAPPRCGCAHADDGLVQLELPVEPWKLASPKVKMPPSAATSQ